ncbi:MAG: hypothetical protein RMY36_024435 [Nostoc sp. SerVER01]|nr:hypothetical protein [Nostoc sp. SerVER01]
MSHHPRSCTPKLPEQSNLVSFTLEDIFSPLDGGIVTDVTVTLDYINDLKPNKFKDVIAIANFTKDFLLNYPIPSGLYEVLNRDLTQQLLAAPKLKLSPVLESLSINLDVSPKIIPFEFNTTNTRTPSGDINDIVSFKLEDILLPVRGSSVTDVKVGFDFIDGIESSEFKDVIPIATYIENFLTNYSNPDDSFEVINSNLADALLDDYEQELSSVLDSLTVNLDVEPGAIPFEFNTITTRTSNGEAQDIVSLKLENIQLQVENSEVADVTVNLDYINGLDPALFADVIAIANNVKDYLTNYPNNPNDFLEVINRNLTEKLFTSSSLELGSLLDSLSVELDVSPKIIPFEFDSITTRTASGQVNDIVSFQLEDILLPIDGTSITDVAVSLDYVDGINSSGFKDVTLIANKITDFLTDYSKPNHSFEKVNGNLTNSLFADYSLGLSSVLDSLTITLDVAPGTIPFPFSSTVTATPSNINLPTNF